MKKTDNKKTKGASSPSNESAGISVQERRNFAFDRDNYKWLLIGMAFLLVGYLLMIGGGSDDPDVFNENMFDFQRLTLSPILLIIGYLLGIYAIMKKPRNIQE
jgi:hypothetical protein